MLTLDAAVDVSSKRMADRVARSPARLCIARRDALLLSTLRARFYLFFWLCFRLFFFFSVPILGLFAYFSSSCYLVRAAVTYSSSSTTCSCVICILPHFIIPCFYGFTFFVVLVSWLARCALVLGTSAFDLPTRLLINSRLFFCFLCLTTACDHRICIS